LRPISRNIEEEKIKKEYIDDYWNYHKCSCPNIKNREPKDFVAWFYKIMNAVDSAKSP
jgi:hypothetical protein